MIVLFGGSVVKQNSLVGSAGWSKAIYLMVARKERWKEVGGWDWAPNILYKDICSSDLTPFY